MDIEKCETLVSVLKFGNIRKAANALGYTPSGVSRSIAALEQECGMTLLIRGKSGVVPTEACKQLAPHINRAIAQKQALDRAVEDLADLDHGLLRVGTAYPQYHEQLVNLLGIFHREHPGITISLIEGNSTPLLAMLDEGGIDLAITSKRPGGFAWHPLVQDKLVALVNARHPLAMEAEYPLKRLEIDSYIDIGPEEETDNFLALKSLGIKPNTCYSVSTDLTSYKLVDAGLGVCLTNSLHRVSYSGSSVFLPTSPEVCVEIGVASTYADVASPAAKAFLDLLLPELGGAIGKPSMLP